MEAELTDRTTGKICRADIRAHAVYYLISVRERAFPTSDRNISTSFFYKHFPFFFCFFLENGCQLRQNTSFHHYKINQNQLSFVPDTNSVSLRIAFIFTKKIHRICALNQSLSIEQTELISMLFGRRRNTATQHFKLN